MLRALQHRDWKRRLAKAVIGRRFKSMKIEPSKVRFLQYPEFRDPNRIFPPPATRVLDGDWDRVIDVDVCWSSVYEPAGPGQCGFVPLARFAFYRALEDRFHHGRTWQETDWYRWIVSRQASGPVRRYATPAEVAERLAFLDSLYDSFSAGAYDDDLLDRPVINIGRDGRLALEDGRHRLCTAIMAGLPEITVDVNVIHSMSEIDDLLSVPDTV